MSDNDRCAICGWPIGNCQPGDCAMRPFPSRYYDAERARKEYAPHTIPDESPPTELELLQAENKKLKETNKALQKQADMIATLKVRGRFGCDPFDHGRPFI